MMHKNYSQVFLEECKYFTVFIILQYFASILQFLQCKYYNN